MSLYMAEQWGEEMVGKITLTVCAFIAGLLTMPLGTVVYPFALAAFAWNEFDKGDYGDE
jgi:hypothetical protein